jgi:hypothetical protein
MNAQPFGLGLLGMIAIPQDFPFPTASGNAADTQFTP